jgi:hypothetical protein
MTTLMEALSTTLTIDANGPNENGTWPFVTISNWYSKTEMIFAATSSGTTTGASLSVPGDHTAQWISSLTLAPIVGLWNNETQQITTRKEWESYSVQHQDWIQDVLDEQFVEHSIEAFEQQEASPIAPYIYDPTNPGNHANHENEPSVYLPLWQTTPISPKAGSVNADGLGIPLIADTIRPILASQSNGVASSGMHAILSNIAVEPIILVDSSRGTETFGGTLGTSPYSLFVQPVYDRLGTSLDSASKQTRQVVAFLIAVISWSDYVRDLVPEDHAGVIVEISATNCENSPTGGSSATFQVESRSQILYMGSDYTRPDDDTPNVVASLNTPSSGPGSCLHWVIVYPLHISQNESETNGPVFYALGIAMILGFICVVFLIYDSLVQRRQETVLDATSVQCHCRFPFPTFSERQNSYRATF